MQRQWEGGRDQARERPSEGFWTWRLVLGFKKPDSPSSSREKNSAGHIVWARSRGGVRMHKWNFLALPQTMRQFQGFWDLSKLKDPAGTHTHTHISMVPAAQRCGVGAVTLVKALHPVSLIFLLGSLGNHDS